MFGCRSRLPYLRGGTPNRAGTTPDNVAQFTRNWLATLLVVNGKAMTEMACRDCYAALESGRVEALRALFKRSGSGR
jgi:hypothetical protein